MRSPRHLGSPEGTAWHPRHPRPPRRTTTREAKRGIKNPGIYAGTIVVLVIVIITFVFVPIGTAAAPRSSRATGARCDFGTYAGKPIEYSQGSYMAAPGARPQRPPDASRALPQDNYQLFAYQVYRGAFERTVVRMAAIDAVKRAGGSVTEDWLDTKVAENPAYQENGKFSAAEVRTTATLAEKLSVRDQIRDDTLYQTYFTDVLGVAPSSKEIDFVKDMAKETRTIEYAAFPLSDYPDAEVAAWGKAHADLFRSLDLSRITIASSEADAKKLLKNITGQEDDLRGRGQGQLQGRLRPEGRGRGPEWLTTSSPTSSPARTTRAKLARAQGRRALARLQDRGRDLGLLQGRRRAVAPADFSQAPVLAAVRELHERQRARRHRGLVDRQGQGPLRRGRGRLRGRREEGRRRRQDRRALPPQLRRPLRLPLRPDHAPLQGRAPPKATPSSPEPSTNEKFLTAAFSLAPGAGRRALRPRRQRHRPQGQGSRAAKDDGDAASSTSTIPTSSRAGPQAEVRDLFMKSPELKDNFSTIFFKYFQPRRPRRRTRRDAMTDAEAPLVLETPGGLSVSYRGRCLYLEPRARGLPRRVAAACDTGPVPPPPRPLSPALVRRARAPRGHGRRAAPCSASRPTQPSPALARERMPPALAGDAGSPSSRLPRPKRRVDAAAELGIFRACSPASPSRAAQPSTRERLRAMAAVLQSEFEADWRNRAALMVLGPRWARNIFDNLAGLSSMAPEPLPSFRGPVLVCGAGPSLEEALPLVRVAGRGRIGDRRLRHGPGHPAGGGPRARPRRLPRGPGPQPGRFHLPRLEARRPGGRPLLPPRHLPRRGGQEAS